MVKDVAELPGIINQAFKTAVSGRPGPVLVDLPKDITAAILRKTIPTSSIFPPVSVSKPSDIASSNNEKPARVILRVANLINTANTPIVYAGQGLMYSVEGPRLLKELADKASIPVTTTLLGLGGFDELDEKSLHMLGMHGSAYANLAIQEADLVIALGARFDERAISSAAKFAPQAKIAEAEGRGGIIHFEIMPENINKIVHATEIVEGDLVASLTHLMPLIKKKKIQSRRDWFDRIGHWKEKFPLTAYGRAELNGLVKPQTLVEELSNLTSNRKESTIITTGVGQHQMWVAQHFRWRYPRSLITSGGLGTMGYGLPAAIGAKVARPDALVIDIDGDASFNMTLTEMSTMAQFNLGVKIIVLNNNEMGMVTQWQSMLYNDRFAHSHAMNPDFIKLAESMGIPARKCISPNDVKDSLTWLIESDGPAFLEVVTDQKVSLMPMVRGGEALDKIIFYDEGIYTI